MYLDELRKSVAEREAQILNKTTEPARASASNDYMTNLRNEVAEREKQLLGKPSQLRQEYRQENKKENTEQFLLDFDYTSLDKRIKELEDYLRQTKIDLSLPWEKEQEELDTLKRQREMARSAQYQKAGDEALSKVDAVDIELLDKILDGPVENTVVMQGDSDNRTWEERYADNEAYLEGFRAELRAKGYDDKEIAQLLDYRQRQKNRENYEAEVAEAVEYAEDHKVGASIKSVGQNLTGGLGYISLAEQRLHNKLTGKDRPLDYYTPEMLGTAKAQAARETVSKDMGKVGAFLYNTGMSMADSAAIMGMAALGIPPVVGSVLLGGTAATSAAMEAKKRGVSDDQALLTGLAAGTFEALFEKVSLDKVLSGKVVAGEMRDRVVQTLKNIGIQSGVEGSEEFFTSVANTMVDNIINGGMSELNTMKRELMANGYSEAEADKMVSAQWAKSLALDFIGGAISGGVFGGVSTGFQTAALDAAYGMEYGDRSAQLTAEAMEINGESKAAQRAARRIAKGKNPTAAQIRTMAEAVEKSVREENEANLTYAVSAVATRLDSLGELGDTEKIAEAVVEMVRPTTTASGRAAAQKVLESSTQGQKALRELRGTMKTVYDRLYAAEGKTINPNAKDKRAVTGVKFNAKTKKMDAIVKKEDGGTETVPMDTSSATLRQMRLAKAAEQYGESGSVMVAGIRDDQDTDTYMGRWNLAYEYGKGGVPKETALASALVRYLRPEQAEMAYEEGAKARAAEGQKKAAEQQAARQSDIKRGEGTVSMEGAVVDGVRYNPVSSVGLSKKQKAAIDVMRLFAKATGVNVVFYESDVNEQGMRAQANGMYRDGVIYLDVAAGVNGEDMTDAAILRTAAHELTHFIQDFSQEEYDAIKDFMLGKLAESKGVSVERLIADKVNRESGLSPAKAVDELIADGCEMMLKNESWLQALQETEPRIAKKILNFLKRWLANLHRAFVGVEAQSAEAKAMLAHMDELQALWNRGLASAVDTYRRTEKNTAEDGGVAEDIGVGVDEGTDSAAPTMFSERTWTESDYVTARNAAAKEIAAAIGVSERKAKAYIDDINSIAKMIADDRTRLDYFSSPLRSSFVSNVEYGGSFDFSTLCKKRRLLTGTFTAIQQALPNTALTAEEILDIRNRMKEKGLEVSCGLCYVEGSRANMGQFAKEFLKRYKKYYPDAWQPNMADVNTPEGIEWVRINHPECYEQYEYFWNHYGTLKSGDKNLFASQQKPKLYQLRTEYKGEVLEHFRKGENVEEKNRNGGIRLQSFSDFEIVHLIDCMQIIMDMSRVGLAGQAYTKVPDFAWALGDTGLKINLSLIAKGVDEKGKLIFDEVEGMPIKEAEKIRARYSKNVGTVLVAFNDEQLLAALKDDSVDFVIPFHRSQWKKSQYAAMGLPAKTKDYTYMQNEKYIRPQYHEYRGRMVRDKATNYMPNEYWDFSKSGKENAIAYLEMCARNNKRPKFYKLLKDNGDGSYSLKEDGSTDGYWKLLIDFKMYDNKGKGSPQMPVKPVFNMAEAKRMLENYEGGHGTFPVARGVVDEFVADYKAKHGGKTQYSTRDTTAITDREILAHTLDSAAQTQAEKTLLERYRAHAEELRKLEGQITYYRNRLKAVENGTAKMSETEKTQARNRINSYARLADREETMLRSLAKKEALQAVLERERSYIEEQGGSVEELKARYEGSLEQKVAELWGQARTWERKYKEAIDNMPMTDKRSEREKMKKLREDIRKKGGRLIRMLETNTDKLHVPEELKEPLGAFLDTIAFRGKNSGGTPAEYAQRLNALAVAIGKKMATVKGRDGETAEGYLDLPQYFRERVEYHAEMAESLMRGAKPYEAVVSRLGLEELQDLDMILSVLSKSIKGINELHTNKHFATVEKAAEDTKRTLKSLGQYEAKGEKLEGYLSWKNILPEYAFRKFGEGGKSIFEALQDGWDKLAFNAAKVIRFTEETYTSKEAEAWNRELHEVELISEGEPVKVQMSAAQIMSLWALSRRKQALGHLLRGGIRLEDISFKGKTIHQDKQLHLEPEDIAKITKLLSSRQLEVAQKLQRFMETQGSAWGNEVSMERHGYNFFGEQNYFPIETDDRGRGVSSTEKGRENDLFRLLNISATKAVVKEANNSVMVRNIFDVYSNHMADMAKYNALALPILDAIKWFNFNTRTESTEGFIDDNSVHGAIEKAYGKAAKNYVTEFLKDLNGVKEGSERGAGLAKNMVSRYKRAQIAANLRVAFLQPTAIVRALAVMQPKYLISAAAEKTKLTEAVKEMQANSGIALWKSMGFFDTDVGRSMREQIRGTQSTYDKAMDKTMIAAEKADELTWAVLWKACKAEVAEKQKLEGDALIKATAKRFRDVIYSTQVVDSTMTRSGLMRSTNFFDKTMTSFMSEPTVTYNMVMGAVDEVRNDARRIGAKEAIKKHSRKLAAAFTTYAVSALAVSLVETLADVWRDDDDETFWEKFRQAMFGQGGVKGFFGGNLVSNLNPLNLIPGVNGAMSLLEGYAPSRMEYGGLTQALKSAQQLWEAFAVRTGIQEKPTEVTYYGNITGYGLFYNASKAVSYLSGAPLSNISREVIAVWNNLCGMAGWDNLKAATYENKKGAANRRIWNAMVENDAAAVEEEKEKMVQTAMDGGEPQRTAVSAANSRVRSIVRDNYWEGEAESGDVERYLQRYGGMTAEEATKQRKEWDCYIETGIKFGDIRTAYETGQIGEADVVRMRTKYGGDTAEEAYDKVLVYDWAMENPLYADIGETDAVGYYEYCERAGIGARLYYEAANETKDATKQEHVDYILSLGLSYSQSKALWLALKTKSWTDTGTPWE